MAKRLTLYFPLVVVLAALLAIYLPTLQTLPNGSDNYYMADVGETQVVLNVWGTLHATGYPHYIILSGALVAVFKALGVDAVTAPALTSLVWGLIALTLVYALALHLTGRAIPTAAVTFLYGLTRTVWIHNAIAEIYTFGLLILVLLLLVALWRGDVRGRVYWLALIGGIGVAHHRGIALVAPALILAVWSALIYPLRRLPIKVVICVLLALIGFVPYVYLPLRAWANATWVYSAPGTWDGFLDQFLGREASHYIGLPASLEALRANVEKINAVLVADVTLPGLLLGLAGLLIALRDSEKRRPALVMFVSAAVAYGFHVVFYTDILSALILPITLSAVFGWLFLVEAVFDPTPQPPPRQRRGGVLVLRLGVAAMVVVLAGWQIAQNAPFIADLTRSTAGLETIAIARGAPSGATLMLSWGPRHGAVGVAREVWGELRDITLVDHKADFKSIIADGMLVTPDFTFYNQPVSWWEARLGTRVYLRAAAPHLVQIDTQPEQWDGRMPSSVDAVAAHITCSPDAILLDVTWVAPETPTQDLSVFVHLLAADGAFIAQADESAPVYGWRPLTTWDAGEAVRDIYPLPRLANAAEIRYGLYHQLADGTFENTLEHTLVVGCERR